MASKLRGVTWSPEAYSLATCHVMKHTGSNVCGLLLGRLDGNKTSVTFERAIPLFHTHPLAPPLKIACLAAEQVCAEEKLEILGYYFAHVLAHQEEMNRLHKNIFERICTNNNLATAWIFSKEDLEDKLPFKGCHVLRNEYHSLPATVHLGKPDMIARLKGKLADMAYLKTYDFDDHFHDITKDWGNQELVGQLCN